MSSESEPKLYALGAEFVNVGSLYHAAEKVRDKGFRNWDVHSPFPIHGMDDAMGLGRSRVSALSLLGGTIGLVTAFVMIYYTSEIDYPLIVNGKPYFALEPSFPIFFELTILFTAFFTVIGMFAMNLMPRLNHPVFNWGRFRKVTDNAFFIVIEAEDPQFDMEGTRRFLEEIGGVNITAIHHDP